jgi:hypothetical protein
MSITQQCSKYMQMELVGPLLKAVIRNQRKFMADSFCGKIKKFSVRVFKALMLVGFSGLMAAAHAQTNQVGFWWKSSEPGWGLSVQQQGTSTFAAWFTYNAQAQPIWYTLTCTFNGNTCAGDLYTASGTPFYQISTSVVLQS